MTREIDTQHAIQRTSIPALDSILGHAFPVLDHGFIRVIDYMGDDKAIVQAARVSYGEGTKHTQSDQGLINYLMRHWHTTPFEMCEIKLHVKLPVFVARQWIRHRTASVNEYSARYSIMDNEFYIPKPEVLAHQSKVNNQGRGELLSNEQATEVLEWMKRHANNTYQQGYTSLIEDYDLARELARMNLPMNIYTQWYWKTNLHNLLRFTRLRADSHAQYEIRVYAEVIENIIADWVPLAFQAYLDYSKSAVSFSGKEAKLLQALIANPVSEHALELMQQGSQGPNTLDMSKGELREFFTKIATLQTQT